MALDGKIFKKGGSLVDVPKNLTLINKNLYISDCYFISTDCTLEDGQSPGDAYYHNVSPRTYDKIL
jgi:hypothetical protein